MKKTLMVVDDSEMARNFHTYILNNEGFDVITAVDGADALEKLYQGNKIDLVVTDINMPVMDGYLLVERIREDSEFEDIPIVIVSTEDEAKDKQRGFNAGANVYIVKPTDPDELSENIKLLMQ